MGAPYHTGRKAQNDILEPLGQRYQVNLVTGAGEMSTTSVVDFEASKSVLHYLARG